MVRIDDGQIGLEDLLALKGKPILVDVEENLRNSGRARCHPSILPLLKIKGRKERPLVHFSDFCVIEVSAGSCADARQTFARPNGRSATEDGISVRQIDAATHV